jgi:hypothetical protein
MTTAMEVVKTDELPAEMLAYAQIIERAASNPEVDVNKLEKLLDMQDRILRQRAEVAFNSGFAVMQGEIPTITEHGRIMVAGVERSRYALFEDINEAVKPVLQKHGFAITFKTQTTKDAITITGILMHKDGHRETTDMMLQADVSGSKNGVQSIGSSISYAKRYVLCALLNISTRGEDDDGVRGNNHAITENQVMDLTALLEEVKADKAKFLKYMKVNSIADIPANSYANAVKALEAKRGK